MKVIDCEKTIALMEKVKKLLPGDDGAFPKKFFTKRNMDTVIQGLRENAVDIDILTNMVGLTGKKKKSDTLLVGFDHSHGDIDILTNMVGLTGKKKKSDTLLVGFDHSHGDIAVLIIGRREPGGKIQIINQFQGKNAEEMYKRLVEKGGTQNG